MSYSDTFPEVAFTTIESSYMDAEVDYSTNSTMRSQSFWMSSSSIWPSDLQNDFYVRYSSPGSMESSNHNLTAVLMN